MAKVYDLGLKTPPEDLQALKELVTRLASKEKEVVHVIEVGAFVGQTALAMAEAGARVACVDHWQGTPGDESGEIARRFGPEVIYEVFLGNIGTHLFRSIFPLVGNSAFWARKWPHGMVDLVFLDADHSYEAVKADIRDWRPLVRPGGILCGHDYRGFPGVTQAVNEEIPDVQTIGHCIWWTKIPETPLGSGGNSRRLVAVGSSDKPDAQLPSGPDEKLSSTNH
jgi:hypothetical protein